MLIQKEVTIIIEKTLSQQCVQIEFVEEIVRLAPAGLLLHHFHILLFKD